MFSFLVKKGALFPRTIFYFKVRCPSTTFLKTNGKHFKRFLVLWKWTFNHFFFYLFFHSSFTDTDNSQDRRGRRGPSYSTLPLPPSHEHSAIYLQLFAWDDYQIFLIATLVFTRLLLDEIYYLIELLFDWLMMQFWILFVCLLNWF